MRAMLGFSLIDPDPERALASVFRHLFRPLQSRLVRSWPVIEAKIRAAILEEITGEGGGHNGWQCRVIYEYSVQGTRYSGKTYGPVWFMTGKQRKKQPTLCPAPTSRFVTIRTVRPNQPTFHRTADLPNSS